MRPRVLLAAGRQGPRGHIILRRGGVRSGRPAATEPRLCRRRARPRRRPAPSCPGGGRGAAWAGPKRDPQRSLGPAGRLRRAGVRETIICSVVMKTATVGCGSISQACLLSLTIFLVPRPTRTVCSFIATVEAGSCQNSARAHTHTPGGGWGGLFLKNERLDSLLSSGALREGVGADSQQQEIPPVAATPCPGSAPAWDGAALAAGPESCCTEARRPWQRARRPRPPPAPSCSPWPGLCSRPARPEVSHRAWRPPAPGAPRAALGCESQGCPRRRRTGARRGASRLELPARRDGSPSRCQFPR